jgi:hypothetical protein
MIWLALHLYVCGSILAAGISIEKKLSRSGIISNGVLWPIIVPAFTIKHAFEMVRKT